MIKKLNTVTIIMTDILI